MAEVQKGEIHKVEDEYSLGENETCVDPEKHEDELEDIIDDEVRADVCGEGLLSGGGGEEGEEVVDLCDEDDDPAVGDKETEVVSFLLVGCLSGKKERVGERKDVPVEIDDEGLQGRRAWGSLCSDPRSSDWRHRPPVR